MEQSLKRYELRKSEMIGLSFGVDFGTNWLGRPVYALFHVPRGSKFTKWTEQGVGAKGKSLFYIYILYYYYSYLVVCSNVPVILEGGKLGVLSWVSKLHREIEPLGLKKLTNPPRILSKRWNIGTRPPNLLISQGKSCSKPSFHFGTRKFVLTWCQVYLFGRLAFAPITGIKVRPHPKTISVTYQPRYN